MDKWLNREALDRLRQGAILLILAAATGAAAGRDDGGLWHGVLAVTHLREAWPLLLVLLPAGGALICLVYSRWGKECGHGHGPGL